MRPSLAARRLAHLVSLTACLLLTLAAPARAADGAASVRVLEGWSYRWGDSPLDAQGQPAWAAEAGEGEGWRPTVALETPPGRGEADFLWLSLPVPSGDWEDPGLLLGSVANAFEVYAGGKRLYASGTLAPGGVERGEHTGWHLVRLPREALGQRVLLRVQSSAPAIGVRRDVRVGSHHALFAGAVRSGLGAFVLGMLFLALGAVTGVAFALWSRQRALLALAAFALSSGLLVTGMSGVPHGLWGAGQTWSVLQLLGGYFFVPSTGAFLETALLQGRMRWFRRGVGGLYAFAAVLTVLMLALPGSSRYTLPLFIVVALSALLACVVVPAIEARRGSADARIFVAGTGAFFLAGIVSALPSFGMLESVGLVIHWGFLALTLSLLGILARRSQQVVRSLEVHTRSLEAQHGQVRQLAERMGEGAAQLSSVVGQLKQATAQQNEGVQRQAASLHEAQATVAEIRQTSRLTAEKAMVLAATAGEAEEIGRDGAQAIERTLGGLEAIRSEVGEMVRRLAAQEARTREIAGIVETVKGLADQSNMLALNAAIEAVRSGEHGKGFGVVAREVRHLADQSIQATERIREILEGVTTSTREAARLGAQGEERVAQSLAAVRESGEGLRKLAQLVGETGQSVRQITAAVSQQDAGTSQIATAISDLGALMERTLTSLLETEGVAQSVEALAEGMADVARQALQPTASPGTPRAA